ncbi:hypothetical protein E5288_WYG002146 [Bos mutus]|uniref:Uncharacterized protein n=1 Tax=Bos mutus TaxID=72004 RepID=A0A6B0SBB1_9CETA|nr:hypothetical protein [Bos mutus]
MLGMSRSQMHCGVRSRKRPPLQQATRKRRTSITVDIPAREFRFALSDASVFVQAPGTVVAPLAYREHKAVSMTWHKLEPMGQLMHNKLKHQC